MDLRPQGHDIIRTWLFSTVLRSHDEFGHVPWSDAALSGWILDPDRKKMSKSKGNVVTPIDLLEQYGSDGVRYWAASRPPRHRHRVRRAADEGRPPAGHQAAQRVEVRAVARRRRRAPVEAAVGRGAAARPGDAGRRWRDWSTTPPSAFEGFDYARALERTEQFFWRFCDDYLELVKGRAYGGGRRRAAADVGPRRPGARAVDAAATVRPVPALHHRGGLVVVDGGLGAPRRVARGRASSRAIAGDADPAALDVAGAGAVGAPRRQVRGQGLDAGRDRDRRGARHRGAAGAVRRRSLADVVEAGNVTELRTEVAEEFSVEATMVAPAAQD